MVKLDLLNMTFGLVHSSVERSTSRHGHLQASARLLYRLALVLVLGLIVWKWVNLEHSMDSNQECGIGFGNLPGSLSHFLAYSRKLGNRRSSEGLRSFKPSRGTNLLVLIILAGDIEMNPGLNAVNAKNIVRRQTRLSSVRNAVNAFMRHAQILMRKN